MFNMIAPRHTSRDYKLAVSRRFQRTEPAPRRPIEDAMTVQSLGTFLSPAMSGILFSSLTEDEMEDALHELDLMSEV